MVEGRVMLSSCRPRLWSVPAPTSARVGHTQRKQPALVATSLGEVLKKGKKKGPSKTHGEKPLRGQRAGSQDQEAPVLRAEPVKTHRYG